MKPRIDTVRLALYRQTCLALAFLGVTLVWATPLWADIYECINRGTGDRVWRNRPCDPNENRKSHQATTPAPAKEAPPAEKVTSAPAATSAAPTTTRTPGQAASAETPPQGAPDAGKPPVSQPSTAAANTTPRQETPDNKQGATDNKQGATDNKQGATDNKQGATDDKQGSAALLPPNMATPPTVSEDLTEVDQILMVAMRKKESSDGAIAMRFQFRNAKTDREIQWESKRKRIFAACSLFLDEVSDGKGDASSARGTLLNQGSGLLGSWKDSFPLFIPGEYLAKTNEVAYGHVECDFDLPGKRRVHTRTIAMNKIPLTSKTKEK
ncbi:MAG: hypothetical protein HQL66_03820 [Magnetococcales bacterium]|nr:hypothetical protein [Magnetococcales bacterium]